MNKINNVKSTQQTLKSKIGNILMYLCIQFSLVFSCCSTCFASNYAENAANWLFDQLFWVALAVTIIAMIKLMAARNIVAGLITLVVGGMVCFFIKQPETIKTIGDVIATAIGLQ